MLNPLFSKIRTSAALTALILGCAVASRAEEKAAAPDLSGRTNESILEVLRRVSRHQIVPLKDGDYSPVDSLKAAEAARAPEGITWNYPWGVTLYGMLRSTDVTHDKDVETFVLEHDKAAARYYAWQKQVRAKADPAEAKAWKTKINGLMNLGSLDSCGAMGTQMLEGILRHPDQETAEEKEVVARIADWVVKKQDRLPDGTLWRSKSMGGTVWLDDLYMGGVFLTRWAKYTHESKHLDDAANQVIHMAALLQDKDGVFWHGYFVNEKRHSPVKWGRANSWTMLATVEVLSNLPENHPARAQLLDILRRHIEGIKPLQAPSGLWRQVLDHPEVWEETSCTAMFAYSIARAVNRGWIDASNMEVARKAFVGICQNVTPEGVVNGTCQGTNIDETLEYYIKRERPSDDLHGRGVVLLAGTEIVAAKK
jgi:rhamnogalacturonyl hydrolase YesR